MRKLFLVTLLIAISVCNCAFANVKVKFLNVGQGDAILIQTDSQNVLIDTSDADERSKLFTELYKAEVFSLDKVILTHPHADHIGNAAELIKDGTITVRAIYDNGVSSTSRYYLNYIAQCKARNVPRHTLRDGDSLDLGGGVTFQVLSAATYGKNANDDSIVGRLIFKKFSVMLTGDAEAGIEEGLLDSGVDLSSDIMKAGHHGSRTSNGYLFVEAVKPSYVIISAGEPTTRRGGNTYGHPHPAALDNFLIAGIDTANILWTWKNGTITIDSDGESFTVKSENVNNWVEEYLGYRISVRRIA